MRIAHLSAEVHPFAKTGGLGDVVGSLPKVQSALGHEVAVWMPLYRQVWRALERVNQAPELAADPFTIDLGYRSHQVGLLRTRLPGSSVPLFLLGCDPYFDRPHIYSPAPGGRDDGLERYALFVRAVLAAMERLDLVPDVLHAHDWHTTLAPMALAWDWPPRERFARTISVLTIHNMAFQGISRMGDFLHLGLPADRRGWLEWDGALNLMKGGILAASAITAVSPTFAHEIATHEGGFGLDPVVRSRGADLYGIVNGIDGAVWNPAVDPKIPFNYDATRLRRKRENRRALLSLAGMDKADPGFVVGVVGRMTPQKGLDMLLPAVPDLLARGVRFVVLGSGEDHLENAVFQLSARATGRFWGYVGFNDELAHLIEAGADGFLMPSRFEPCGLNQLYSLAYGTPPIVRQVGGLADTVVPFDGGNRDAATGFGFHAPTPLALRDTVAWAQRCYADPALWTTLVKNGMAQDYRWERSAERYLEVYRRTFERRGMIAPA